MKNNVSCPKCGGTEIIKIPRKAGAYGSGNNIMIGMTIFSAILVNRYVCSDCGYSEEWIDTKDLEKLKKSKIGTSGIGGVGYFVCQAFARVGIGELVCIDNVEIIIRNLNRQSHATHNTIGKPQG